MTQDDRDKVYEGIARAQEALHRAHTLFVHQKTTATLLAVQEASRSTLLVLARLWEDV